MSPYELVIFDSDGVLVDSEPLSERVFGAALDRLGLTLSAEQIADHFQGRSMPDCVRVLREEFGCDAPDGFVPAYEQKLFEVFRRDLQPVRGVREALLAIETPKCVASSGSHEKIRTALTITGLLGFFGSRIFSGLDVKRSKPAPDLFLMAAGACGVAPAQCVVVEDSVRGVQAGLAAGMRVIGYAADGSGRRLAAEGADVITCMSELANRIQT